MRAGGTILRVTVRLKAFRGEEKLSEREAKLRPAEAPAFLQKAAGELVAADANVAQKRPDPHQEAQRLTELAAEFQRLGQWEESLALVEAALLLEPSQERHYRAVGACAHVAVDYVHGKQLTFENKNNHPPEHQCSLNETVKEQRIPAGINGTSRPV